MICDECKKNKATVHLTEIINDQISKLNLCEACAKEKGSNVEQHFGIADLLSALSDADPGGEKETSASGVRAKCTHCGMAYEDFKKIGRLGCSECYLSFKTNLAPLLKRIHGSNQHVGKSPHPDLIREQKKHTNTRAELEDAKKALQKAVKNEEFEEAATLRDKIKFIEKKIKEAEKGKPSV